MDFFCQNTQCVKRLRAGGLQPGTSVRCPACGHVQAVPEDRGDIIDLPDLIVDVLPADASVPAHPGGESEDAVRADHGAARRRSRSRRRVYLDLLCPYCGAVVLVSDMECPACKKSLHDVELEQEEAHLKRQRLWFQVLSFALGLPGFVLIQRCLCLARGAQTEPADGWSCGSWGTSLLCRNRLRHVVQAL